MQRKSTLVNILFFFYMKEKQCIQFRTCQCILVGVHMHMQKTGVETEHLPYHSCPLFLRQGVPKNLTLTVWLHWPAISSNYPVSASPLTDMCQQLGYDMSRRYQNSISHNCAARILGAESFIQSMYSFNGQTSMFRFMMYKQKL